jgi:hypothetical protein
VWPVSVSRALRTTGRQAARQVSQPPREPAAVILAVIPPRTTSKTGSDQVDGIVDLTCKDGIGRVPLDGWGATHNRSVAGSRPASPTQTPRSTAWTDYQQRRPPPHGANGQRPGAGSGDDQARIGRVIAALLRKAAATSFPHEAAACRDKAEALRVKVRPLADEPIITPRSGWTIGPGA